MHGGSDSHTKIRRAECEKARVFPQEFQFLPDFLDRFNESLVPSRGYRFVPLISDACDPSYISPQTRKVFPSLKKISLCLEWEERTAWYKRTQWFLYTLNFRTKSCSSLIAKGFLLRRVVFSVVEDIFMLLLLLCCYCCYYCIRYKYCNKSCTLRKR